MLSVRATSALAVFRFLFVALPTTLSEVGVGATFSFPLVGAGQASRPQNVEGEEENSTYSAHGDEARRTMQGKSP